VEGRDGRRRGAVAGAAVVVAEDAREAQRLAGQRELVVLVDLRAGIEGVLGASLFISVGLVVGGELCIGLRGEEGEDLGEEIDVGGFFECWNSQSKSAISFVQRKK
jgi:hypothetical protein